MTFLTFDHIAVAAATLQEGVQYVEQALGVKLTPGGKHAFMGTHNQLLRLGSGLYLEVIAIDPDAEPPARLRWFSLDSASMKKSLSGGPRIVHWIVRTADIKGAINNIEGATQTIVAASRGKLHWQITIPEDGSLPYDGAFPTFIEWPVGPHVSDAMPESGCSLEEFVITSPSASRVSHLLAPHFDDTRVQFHDGGETRFQAEIMTPGGKKRLS